jgi:hypothetical protein
MYKTWILIVTRIYLLRLQPRRITITVSATAFTNNALAGHLRVPLGPTRQTLLPGTTKLLDWLDWLC